MSQSSESVPQDDALFDRVYGELRGIAKQQMIGERPGHTLQATALVNEAWMRLSDQVSALRDHPGRFFLAAAESMRRILIDHARKRGRQKRGGADLRQLSLDVVQVADTADLDQVLAIDSAIESLQKNSERAAMLVRLRFFTGLTEQEAADVLEISERTARREWAFARAWMFRELND